MRAAAFPFGLSVVEALAMADEFVIVDYNSGNLRSAQRAAQEAARRAGKSLDVVVTNDPSRVATARRILLPGVGSFGGCRDGLFAIDGMLDALNEAVIAQGRPFMGICVGMQLLATRGLEFGSYDGLGWIGGEVVALPQPDRSIRLPHMGWNIVSATTQHPVLGACEGQSFYFANSYMFDARDDDHELLHADYGTRFCAGVARDNIVGVQFHPEKSQRAGLALITRFLDWDPK